ncbi:MAG: Maf family nucleotide pyrophosphatase [Rikenellaceae bacterium]|nr:Maf family nucleotide pyrophosphatase [Rikenellaceae bacterium]
MLLKDKLNDKRLILASRSPRRRDLLAGCGLKFDIADQYEVEEVFPDDLTAAEVPAYLAKVKSAAYPARLAPGEILLTADTVVLLDNEILGKPADKQEAISMLSRLSGCRHTVVTGVAIRCTKAMECFSVKSDVWFRRLRDDEIEYYVDNFLPLDKAGAYGIQEWIGYVGIGRIEGSFYNVMGLPIQSLYVNLDKFIDDYMRG